MSTDQHPEALWDLIQHLIFHPDRQHFLNSWVDQEPTSLSSLEFCHHVLKLAKGLKTRIQKGEKIGLMGASSPLWMACDFAIIGAGGITVPLFPNMSPEVLRQEIDTVGIKKIFYLTQNAILDWEGLPMTDVFAPEHLKSETPHQSSFTEIEAELPRSQNEMQQCWHELNQDQAPEQLATVLFTSGSTGVPKAIPLSHKNLISQVTGAAQRIPLCHDQDIAFSFLPLAHIFERMVTYYYLHRHIPIYFCDDMEQIGVRIKASAPTIMTTVPRLLEKVQSSMSQRTLEKPSPSKEIGRWALRMALTQPMDQDWNAATHFLADRLIYKKYREALGGRLKKLIVGGAALSPRLARFYTNIGIPTFQGYGLSESSPVIALNYPEHNKEGMVGKAFPGVDIKIDPVSSEICARGPGIMSGYLNAENVVDEDGWLHTGDMGELDEEGYLKITGRIKELFKTSNGKYVCPIPIEDALTSHPWVDQAVVIAEGRKYVTALLVPDFRSMPIAESSKLEHHQFDADSKDLLNLNEHLKDVNLKLNPWEKVQKIAWLPKPLSIENDELTPTMKIKRHVVEKKYIDFIKSLYNVNS
jgi:long-chain acyl-CoA synthetase